MLWNFGDILAKISHRKSQIILMKKSKISINKSYSQHMLLETEFRVFCKLLTEKKSHLNCKHVCGKSHWNHLRTCNKSFQVPSAGALQNFIKVLSQVNITHMLLETKCCLKFFPKNRNTNLINWNFYLKYTSFIRIVWKID